MSTGEPAAQYPVPIRGTVVIVFARAPQPGRCKTRLIPALGAQRAAALAERMLAHAVRCAVEARRAAVELCVTPDAGHPAFARLAAAHGIRVSSQAGGDLGARMHHALCDALARHRRALLMGTDAPALDARVLRDADRALADHDAVFVPALDGGYALVGLRQPVRALFDGIAWSTPAVMDETRRRARRAGLRWRELAPLADVDEPADLRHLPPAWLA